MKLHIVALPHTRVEPSFSNCAYTMKVLKFCKMMGARHELFVYAPEGAPIPGATLIPCLTDAQRIATFEPDDNSRLPQWPTDIETLLFNTNVAKALEKNASPRDLVLLVGGRTNMQVVEKLPNLFYCEPGVGYEGIFTDRCAFESYAWMHQVYAKANIHAIRWFDCVIPPYCDPDEFPYLNDGKGKYLLFMGRLISTKGPHIAQQIAKAAGLPLYVAGPGGKMVNGKLEANGCTYDAEGIKYFGSVGIEERAKLMAGAKALIVATTYCEPGGNVAVEAQLAGTPVIVPDWGVYSETVTPGINGFHFRMFQEAVNAVRQAGILAPADIRDYAVGRYSLQAIAPMYDRWFDQLMTLHGDGWYAGPDNPNKKVVKKARRKKATPPSEQGALQES